MIASRIRRRDRVVVVLFTSAVTAALLAACGEPGSDHSEVPSSPPAHSSAAAMKPGMVMSDGSTMGADPSHAPAKMQIDAKPSPTATMVCSSEIRHDIATVLDTRSAPAGVPRWTDHTYTCTYHLPMGRLVLSVHETADPATALHYTQALRRSRPDSERLDGLTDVAFGNPAGTVTLVKDADTLTVDASDLPAQFGATKQKRSDFAYELASDILGCWTGDDS